MFGQQNLSSLSPQDFCNFLEMRPNSDQIKTGIGDQILLSGSILWFWWHARFSGLANSGHAQKPFFTSSNEPNIFALPSPRRRICMRGSFDKMQSQILEKMRHQGDICTPERGNLPIHQTSSLLPIVYLNIISRFFPNTGKSVTKSSI